ncbi:MAG: TonB-dependent receptor [Sphingomonadales bacterium]|nr:TonB-dependent receptor [Sphingomonadales bacterium]MDE2569771.1 TonB-dependent receptor [Sphingomonadales bacterium]
MRGKLTLLAGVAAAAVATPVYAQSSTTGGDEPIIVTAQRQAQKLQDVPVAVSAFNSEALEKQQIKNTSDLQLSLPNVTFTKTNFTSSSFTIRGIGDLCVGVTCDSATGIAINDSPLFATRLFEGEFYDIGQIQVLRGPQGTLFGRNATSGVVDIGTAKPDLNGIHANIEGEYGNYNGYKLKGMVNVPLTQTLGVRVAGFYLKRDGFTKNLYDNSRIDDRDLYGFRGSLRFEPSSSTTIDLMAQYFHEKDHRMRAQKQVCQRDPTGILGCLNATLPYQTTNANSQFSSILTSKQFLTIAGIPAPLNSLLALSDLYGPDVYGNVVNPSDPRVVNTPFTPQYFTDEWIVQGSWNQELGSGLNLKVSGDWQKVSLDSEQDYSNAVIDRSVMQPGLNMLAAGAAGAFGAGLATYLSPIASALMPQGPAGPLCTSLPETTGTGVYGGHSICSSVPLAFDRSDQFNTSWSGEALLTSKWDGMFNFLLGANYSKFHLNENSYYVNGFTIDYLSGLLGTMTALGKGLPPSYLATPFYRNNSTLLNIESYGLFGEGYLKFNDKIKLTLGLRYTNDKKHIEARTSLASWLTPFGSTNAYASPYFGSFDADANQPGIQPLQIRDAKFDALTGRAVLDMQLTPDNMVYLSYSRGYKSGGINPPLSPVFSVPENFSPEYVNAFEIGSKNQFGGLTLNLTGFYYKYKDLQLSRIVARTSVNDNVSANIYGAEIEAIIHPIRAFTVNVTASYLHTEVSQDKYLANPRDFGGGRSDAVIIKDVTNAANCAVGANTAGNAAGVNTFVNFVNSQINAGAVTGVPGGAGLQGTTAFPTGSGIASTGAYSVCAVLTGYAAAAGKLFDPAGITVYNSGIPVNIRGNELPGAPNFKVAAGAQYEIPVGNMSITPRVDVILTGDSTGSIFNGVVNRIPSYTQINAQVQFDGPDKRWFIRGYVQNLSNSNPITGLYVTDQSSGSFTNIFTLEPRRYGVAAGFKF